MKRIGWVLICGILGSLNLGVSAAGARVVHPTTDPVTLAIALGEEYWRAIPCGGQIAIKSAALAYSPTSQSGATAPGLADGELEPTMRSAWNEIEGRDVECEITVNSGLWPNWLAMDRRFHWFCDGIAHELGHFLGHRDDGQRNPAAITYPVVEPGSPNFNSVPQCRHVPLW